MARMFIAMSIDSGKTWAPSPNPLIVLNNALSSTFMTGRKATITVRVLGGDRPGVAFKMTARQAAPVLTGNPQTKVLGLMAALTPGANVGVVMGVRVAGDTSTDGFCTIAKVYWDALGDGTIDDSTTGANALAWTWPTQVPSGAAGQRRAVIARAKDKNGLSSAPETLTVKFGLPNLIGVWTGATSRAGGGGCVKDASGNCTVNASGDTLWNYDSMGVVLTITQTNYSIVRGDKTWGSSEYGRDSAKSVGSWTVVGNKAIFTATVTPTVDSCFWKDETYPWTIDDGIYQSCLPPDTLTIDTTGNTWNTQIVNNKLTIYQQITLIRQQ